ncbi:MAG TPA: AsnC family protein, partial [Tenuifilaceae bacterium]|nr:AsnC family protein [Tenuifilaceae bacterium]
EKQHILDSLKNAQTLALEKFERQKEVERARLQKYILFFIFIFSLVIVAVIIRFRSLKIKTEKDILLSEIQMLKSVAVVNLTSGNEIPYNKHLNREKISEAINGVLNDSDWNILSILCESPTISNREISEKILLSFEGVRSSLKKMYRVFDIQNSVENQRIALVIKAIRISNT